MSTHPDTRALVPRAPTAGSRPATLPLDLLQQAARRLRGQALMYAFGYSISDLLPNLLFADARHQFLMAPIQWVPPAVSVTVALIVAAATMSRSISPERVLTIGLFFEVAGSIGIVAAESLDGSAYANDPPWIGLSWVAVWVVGFSIIVPSPPRRALVAALASVSSVPIIVGAVLASGSSGVQLAPWPFFFRLVLPYTIVVVIAYWGARAVYSLGAEVARARDMGSYRLTARLGQGGMGEVWRAEHRLLARPAAVKLMRPETLGALDTGRRAEFHARFEREAQATAVLRSPHTVELYDFGVAHDGTLYYVMELLNGFDLGTLIDRFGPAPPERAVYLLAQMCHSLGEAHARGLIHRDIKPANVFVCRYGREEDFLKVLDFGLVKAQGREQETALDLSRDHVVGGTPAFMAPEQALGDRPVDHRADIYAAGCVAYWLVTGQRVFSGGSTMEILMHHVQSKPVRPSERTEGPVPEALDALIVACLEKDPADRPATADDLLARLEDIGLAQAWTANRRRDWWQTHRPDG